MIIPFKRIKSTYIYHCVIWIILIFFKLIMDYSFFGNLMLLMNLKVFVVFMAIFYINYGLFLPFIIKQNPRTRITIVFTFVILYIASFIFFMPHHPPFPPKEFPKPGRMMKPFEHGLNFHDMFFKIGLFSIIFSTLLFFVDKWLENQKMIKALEFERQSSELKILREQINPHFFFNALNSIYSLSITKSKDTPRVILILSDIMRYVLNDKNGQKNNLNDEIINIKKYIEIQSIRFNKFNNINWQFYGNFEAHQIEPLLLLTFIENAFKYADFKKGPLDILINLKDGVLNFNVKNFYETKPSERTANNKLGIKNTKMKLDLLYPEKYKLDIHDNGSEYEINLTLQLD
ncbi:histidine kinase [Epilithonimonas sp. JDS]|uniref:sensor histidine kinase n=1 Tax=Epilithonimonas sp. JDS TaxID=2902797 RepID=UPI001E4A6858|nr:sensor histidine kinase [Epilithonimonas sp. JDS]MCD9853875.1 histidine kinase [Epilithonimonas sp. JDS]